MNISIAYDGHSGYEWAAPELDKGTGGSEAQLIMLAREFARMGHEVTVFNNCGGYSGDYEGVFYRPLEHRFRDCENVTNLLISWRNWKLLEECAADVQFHASHDVPIHRHHPQPWDDTSWIDKIIYLNQHHRLRSSAWWPEARSEVIPIGIDDTWAEVQVNRDPARCIYFSDPGRGLPALRHVWPAVKAAVPQATLASFWWQPERYIAPYEVLGILPMSRLTPAGVKAECMRAGVFAYPCQFPEEISPATTIQAQKWGAYPCCIIQGGMCETLAFGCNTVTNNLDGYTDLLIRTLKQSIAGDLEHRRKQMMEWGKTFYSVRRMAENYIEAYWRTLAEKSK